MTMDPVVTFVLLACGHLVDLTAAERESIYGDSQEGEEVRVWCPNCNGRGDKRVVREVSLMEVPKDYPCDGSVPWA